MITPTFESDILLIVLGVMSLVGLIGIAGALFSMGRAGNRKD